MKKPCTRCIKGADEIMKCPYCKRLSVKNGKSRSGKQRYHCRYCKRYFIDFYTRLSYQPQTNDKIIRLLKEGLGISNLSRFLKISKSTILRRILLISEAIKRPPIIFNRTYEVDELWTFIGTKANPTWIIYAICRETKEVFDFTIGVRSNENIVKLTGLLLLSNPVKVFTDRLLNYKTLIPSCIHHVRRGGTNHIERRNLTLRTNFKRTTRRTICFSKSSKMLSACLKIYFWG